MALTALELGTASLFSTAFDPSDLPGASVDPLGFEAAYVALADVLLPGLTTITDSPRYPAMLCAGLIIAQAQDGAGAHDVGTEDRVLERLMRFERLWALASVLHWRNRPDDRDETLGSIRGITYATHQAQRIEEAKLPDIQPDFQFLRRQRITGAVGVYRTFLEGAALCFRNEWRLTPDLGQSLGEAFRQGTGLPSSVRRSVIDAAPVSVSTLRNWGQLSHPARRLPDEEKRTLRDAVLSDPPRRATLGLLRLAGRRLLREPDGELKLIKAMATLLRERRLIRGVPRDTYPQLLAVLDLIPAYEAAYRRALLGFERILWLVRQNPGGIPKSAVLRDPVVKRLGPLLEQSARSVARGTEASTGLLPEMKRTTLADVLAFVDELGKRAGDGDALLGTILERHRQIQEGKFDKGRRKSAWVVQEGQHLRLTFARVGGLDREVTDASGIPAHVYRLSNAWRFMTALDITA
jgi:hypothetical protein